MKFSSRRLNSHQVLRLTFVINALILAVVFLIPFNSDLDLYHAMGLELTHGHLPYLGSWDHNFPAIVYVHAAAIAIFGKGYIGFRVLDLLTHLAIVIVLYQLALRYSAPAFAAVGATLNSLYYVGGSFWLAGQKDGFAVLFIGISVLSYFRSKGSNKAHIWLAIAGSAMGIATAFRPTYGLFSVSIVFVALMQKQNWHRIGIFVASHAAIWILILLPYAFIQGGLSQFYNSVIAFNLEVYGGARGQYYVPGLLRHPFVLVALPSLLPWVGWLRKRWPGFLAPVPSSERWFGFFALASAWLSIYVMGKYLVYHFDPFMAVLAVFAARGIEKLYWIIPGRVLRISAMAAIATAMVRVLYPFDLLHDVRDAALEGHGPILETVWREVKNDSLFGLRAEEQAAAFLEQHTRPGEKVEVCTIMPALRWRLDRAFASPFTIAHPYAMHLLGQPFTPFQDSWRTAFANAIATVKPKYLVLATEPHTMDLFSMRSPAQAVLGIPAVRTIIEKDYIVDTAFGPYIYYRCKGS